MLPGDVARLTVADVTRVFRGWKKSPPTHRLMAAWLRYKPPKDSDAIEPLVNERELDALIASTR